LPYGIVKLGPDCGDLFANSGYYPNGEIHGFSHTHVNGTGGGPKYGNILFMPGIGMIKPDGHTSLRDSETFKVGYYSTVFAGTGIKTELTCTHSCGFHRYTFPATDDAYILVDAGSFLTTTFRGEDQNLVGSEIEIVNDHEIRGYSRVRGGWNAGEAYTVYFHAIFDTPAASYGTWKGDRLKNDVMSQYDEGLPTGGYLRFKTSSNQSIKAKVGISFVSTGKAKANLMKEIPHWNFDQICNEADTTWENLLSKVQVEGGTESTKRIFYSSLYRIFLQPTDKTGENPKWAPGSPYYDDFYAIWDTYRATHPFITLVNENRQIDIVNALIDIYKNDKYMPDARSGFSNGRTQGGSNCDVLIADAFAKKLKGIDYEAGLASMIKNAEIPPGDNERSEGRGGIPDYNNLGYVSINYERSGSRTVEYAYNDWCLAQVAKGLGKDSIARKYIQRSGNWQNLWRPIRSEGFTGFIMPRNHDGSWWEGIERGRPFTVHSAGSWTDVFYESNSWEYSLYAPHDVHKLIEKCGGTETFIARLDTFFSKRYFNVSNEPGFLTPCLYSYAGVQYKTAKTVRDILTHYYKDAPDGIPGNDDSGSMAAWYCFHALGFFPNAGQDLYLISSPVFRKVVITMDNGKTFTITSINGSEKNIYIQSAKLNGKPLDRSWFRHTEIRNGGTLEFVMTDKPVHWDTGELPPSESE
jgi:predicted alpha-1,2-mannosidase